MKKFVFAFVLVFFAFAMSSCVQIAYGPSGGIADAEYVQSVQPVVDSNEAIKFMYKGCVFANTATPGPAMTWGVVGTIVVTYKTLYLLYWNPRTKVFDVRWKLPITEWSILSIFPAYRGPETFFPSRIKNVVSTCLLVLKCLKQVIWSKETANC